MIDASPRQVLQRRQFRRLFGPNNRAPAAAEPSTLRLPAEPPIQRMAEFRFKQQTLNAFSPDAVTFLNEGLQKWMLMGYVPPDLLHGLNLDPASITPIVRGLFEDQKIYGVFNLDDRYHLQRLMGIIVHNHRVSQAGPGQAAAGQPGAGGRPAVARVGRNNFEVVEKPKAEILETLALWNAYYQYKMAQYDAIRDSNPGFYGTFSRLDSFKNFENVGPMIAAVLTSVQGKSQRQIHEDVRVAINPAALDKIAAILIYSSRPAAGDPDPGYVADLLANPKSIKPDRKEPGYKGHKAGIADPSVKRRGRAVLPEASEQRGAGNSLLQHAVLESGPGGIQLWPFDETAARIYLAMDFGGAKFVEDSGHLFLQPTDMTRFQAHAQGALRETIVQWRARYG